LSPSKPNLEDILNDIEQKSSTVDHTNNLTEEEITSLNNEIDTLKRKILDKVDRNRKKAIKREPCLRVLIIDESILARAQIKKLFAGLNVVFDEASCGPDAQDILEYSQDYDLITLDLDISVISGKGLLNQFKDAKLPFVIVSPESGRSTIAEELSDGTIHFLNKPFDSEKAKGFIQQSLKSFKVDLEKYSTATE
jgi:CheY-like chemotaxis protein